MNPERAGRERSGPSPALDLQELGPERQLACAELQVRARQNRWQEGRLQFLAKEGGEEVGFLSFDLHPGKEYVVLYEVYVPRRCRRRGIGNRLLAAAEQIASQQGAALLLIRPGQLDDDVPETQLRAWYARHGFQPWAPDPEVLQKRLSRESGR